MFGGASVVVTDVSLNLRKEAVQGFHRSDRAFQCLRFAEYGDFLRRILQTDTICGAVRAQHFHRRGRDIGAQTVLVNLSFSGRYHLLLLSFVLKGTQAGSGI